MRRFGPWFPICLLFSAACGSNGGGASAGAAGATAQAGDQAIAGTGSVTAGGSGGSVAATAGSGGAGSGSGGSAVVNGGSTGTGGAAAGAAGAMSGGAGGGNGAPGLPEVSNDGDGDVMIGPTYMQAPEMSYVAGVPKGKVTMFNMSSADSKIYPGIQGPYMRPVWVYVPAQYVPGTPAPFILAQDGDNYLLRLPPILDNMIAAKRLPVMLAVMANSGGGNDKGSERGLEYDTVSDKFLQFVQTELLPKAATVANVVFTTDPNGRATMGGSSGGAAAFTLGWSRPRPIAVF